MRSYRGSELWKEELEWAQASWRVLCREVFKGTTYVEADAQTGWRYVVVATPLGRAGQENQNGEVLVTVLMPWTDAYVFSGQDPIRASYVGEKLTRHRWQTENLAAADLAALTLTVASALDREPVVDVAGVGEHRV